MGTTDGRAGLGGLFYRQSFPRSASSSYIAFIHFYLLLLRWFVWPLLTAELGSGGYFTASCWAIKLSSSSFWVVMVFVLGFVLCVWGSCLCVWGFGVLCVWGFVWGFRVGVCIGVRDLMGS